MSLHTTHYCHLQSNLRYISAFFSLFCSNGLEKNVKWIWKCTLANFWIECFSITHTRNSVHTWIIFILDYGQPYGHGPWLGMVNPVSDRGPGPQSVTGQKLWCHLTKHGHELPWSIMVVHGWPWYFVGDHGSSWSIMVAHELHQQF